METKTKRKWPSQAHKRSGEVAHARSQAKINLWIAGGPCPWKSSIDSIKRIKVALVVLRGTACEECGWNVPNPFSGKVYTEMDHIDGNRMNNLISNLKILCPNCHALTSTIHHLNRK